jgi:hypothetical protein
MIKETVRKKKTRENSIVDVATPGRNIVRERHVRILARLSRKGRTVIK